MPRRGRPKKYTPNTFYKAVNHYFRRISTVVPVLDPLGNEIMDVNNRPIERTVYVIPPTISGLCLEIGIDRSTWQNYADPEQNPEHAAVCEEVRLRIEAYLNEQLLTREKSVQGVIFNLSNNFGWSEKHEHNQRVELGEETRKALGQKLTMDERFAVIREAAEEITGSETDDGNDEDAE